jgi:hypothetical protein
MAAKNSATTGLRTALPPDNLNRKLTVASPDDPNMRHISVAAIPIRSS